jgi:hypothetical protein
MVMELVYLQRAMAHLVRVGMVAACPAEPEFAQYLHAVSRSTGLKVMREVVREWRYLLLRQGCPLTSGALLGIGCFESSVEQFMAEQPLHPLAQHLAADFMTWVGHRRDDDIASIASFEQALIAVRRGVSADPVVVSWRCAPMAAFSAALRALPLPPPHPDVTHTTEVASHLPGGFVISEI